MTPADSFPQPSSATVPESACRSAWARLLAKIYEVEPLVCPRCCSKMCILAMITDPGEVKKILRHLIEIGRPPLGRQTRRMRVGSLLDWILLHYLMRPTVFHPFR